MDTLGQQVDGLLQENRKLHDRSTATQSLMEI